MVEADLKLLAENFKKACLEKIEKQNQLHNLNQAKSTEEIKEAKH
jgi:hypothetical protein